MLQQLLPPGMKLPPGRRQLEQEDVVTQELADLSIRLDAHSHEGWNQGLGGIDEPALIKARVGYSSQGCKSAEAASRKAEATGWCAAGGY
ncbi:hypothetical protein [Cyanobium sp. Morenito 9A2]|uniref:hypothetical protein n=1 Tax=Cyanobium sp. Morenito 9A2 TaxID=2823718 RepID=UPI0020CFA0D7|nr:hypothetical protein [Cyanobium sp. Morenito 9A2]MCP9849216.1 hypothetical protein [Cyanobium sp. Morenito 9A2]